MRVDAPGVASSQKPLGILAGGGGLPEQIADCAVAGGRAVHIVAIEGEAEQGITRFPHTWVNWGAIGRMSASLRAAGARDLIIVGSVTRPDLRKVRPDFGLVRAVPTIVRLFGGGDDHVLRNVVRFFEAQGFVVRGAADVAVELLVVRGTLGDVAPTTGQLADAALGFAIVDALGRADVGQAVVIKSGQVLAIEAAEGTDRMLARLGHATRHTTNCRGAILVKRPKPGQELRVDMPAIGPRTVEVAAQIGLAGIAVEAGRVLIAERGRVIANANRAGIFVTGCDAAAPAVHASAPRVFASLTRARLAGMVPRDIARAVSVAAIATPFVPTAGVVVVRRHVIAIETGEGIPAMIERVMTLRQWGADARSNRRGVLALTLNGATAITTTDLVSRVAAAGLAAIVLTGDVDRGVADAIVLAAQGYGVAVAQALDPVGVAP